MVPFFSIIIPCYNSAAYIDATLASLHQQTFRQFEVIVIDDRSTDNSVEVCNETMSRHGLNGIIIERPAELEKGVASCRNFGVSKANAEWVSFLDSDDLFLPEKLELTYEQIAKYRESCLAYHHGCRTFEDGTGKTLNVFLREEPETPADIIPELLDENIIVTSTVTINKELLTRVGGFDTNLHGVEDYMLWLKVSKKAKWCYCNKVLTEYRVRNTSLMGGREMTHYVQQNTSLLNKLKGLKEFTRDEIKRVDRYFFANLMPYYAMVSLKSRGWGDFTKGMVKLAGSGKPFFAAGLFFKFFKRHMLSVAVKNLKR